MCGGTWDPTGTENRRHVLIVRPCPRLIGDPCVEGPYPRTGLSRLSKKNVFAAIHPHTPTGFIPNLAG